MSTEVSYLSESDKMKEMAEAPSDQLWCCFHRSSEWSSSRYLSYQV